MKNITILGSTGSIGESALGVVRSFPDSFRVIGLSTQTNINKLSRQAREFKPLYVCVGELIAARKLKGAIDSKIKILVGEAGLRELAGIESADTLLLAITGASALSPLLKAIESAKHIALANKEALVMAGSLITRLSEKYRARILPIDSEQSAIWQCLSGKDIRALKKIYLTASGGPFKDISLKALKNISIEKVLRHPRWKMGRKITVDSATLMNKGLELLEAMFLFGVPLERIKILIHPECIVHSMVEFVDGVVMAQLSQADMRIPIQYALTYPERLVNSIPAIDFPKLGSLHFEEPDFKKFPCLELAHQAASELGSMPAVMNAANEASVGEFLKKGLKFLAIPEVIKRVMDKHHNKKNPDLNEIKESDRWARQEALNIIRGLN